MCTLAQTERSEVNPVSPTIFPPGKCSKLAQQVSQDENEVRAHSVAPCITGSLILKFPEEETCSLAQPDGARSAHDPIKQTSGGGSLDTGTAPTGRGNPVSPTIFLWKMLPTRVADIKAP